MNSDNSKEGFHQKCPDCEMLKMENTKLAQLLSEQKARNEKVRGERLIMMVRDLCLPQMTQLYTSSACSLALKRLPALSLTLCLELLGGLIISQLHQVIKIYTLIVSFMPAISALSGNLGLQASANTIRGLGTGERSLGNISNYWRTDCSLQVTSTPLGISQT